MGTGTFWTNVTCDFAALQTNDLWSLLARVQTIVGAQGLNEAIFQTSDFVNIIKGVTQPDFRTADQPFLTFPTLRAGLNALAPQSTFQRKYELRDTFSYSLDTHDLKFGGGVLQVDPLGVDIPFGLIPGFEYANDGDPNDQAVFFSMFDFLPPIQVPVTSYGAFFQDD